MPITQGLTSRTMCDGPPKQGHLEKRLKKKIPASQYDPKLRGGGEIVPPKSSVASYVAALKWDESQVNRVPAGSAAGGEFASEGGGFPVAGSLPLSGNSPPVTSRLTPAQQAMQESLASQASKPIHKVKTAEEAVPLVLRGENVEIQDTKEIHTLLKKLGEIAIQAKAMGEKAPNFDPCTITVKHVSLFCTEKLRTEEFPHGIPRIEMPQFKTKNPVPGSKADKLPRDENGEVNATQMFIEHLQKAGVHVNPEGQILARKLKASQAQMEGAKVAGMMLDTTRDPKTQNIWVSRDGYVIDGHHTWAAAIGRDAEDGNLDNDKKMHVIVVDLPMSEVYHLARDWTKAVGIPGAGVTKRDRWMFALKGSCPCP